MKEALLYERLDGGKVKCSMCAHRCTIEPGRRGICGVRENHDGTLMTLVYGMLISGNVDPIEKKPLFHFLPGSKSYSIATVGCNLRCRHCQNADISQFPHLRPEHGIPGELTRPQDVVADALSAGCASIAYTYTEPTIFMEFCLDTAQTAQRAGLKNIFVSNGFMTPQSARLIAPFLDGNNIDLKGNDRFYREVCKARLGPVKETIALMKELGVWVEVTTLVIPGWNDSEADLKDIAEFIHSVDPAMPWHVTRFHPTYQMMDRPVTPVETLRRARAIGLDAGLKYVYEGNVPDEGGENTYCPSCGELLIERMGYRLTKLAIEDGRCAKCGEVQNGVWK